MLLTEEYGRLLLSKRPIPYDWHSACPVSSVPLSFDGVIVRSYQSVAHRRVVLTVSLSGRSDGLRRMSVTSPLLVVLLWGNGSGTRLPVVADTSRDAALPLRGGQLICEQCDLANLKGASSARSSQQITEGKGRSLGVDTKVTMPRLVPVRLVLSRTVVAQM
jgi:hypothetical protein